MTNPSQGGRYLLVDGKHIRVNDNNEPLAEQASSAAHEEVPAESDQFEQPDQE